MSEPTEITAIEREQIQVPALFWTWKSSNTTVWTEEQIRIFAKWAYDILRVQIISDLVHGEEIRTAALEAMHALDWIAQPDERIEVRYGRPTYKRLSE